MISCKQFRQYIIKPALMGFNPALYSADIEELLIATMAHESKGGQFLHQEHGPALGPFQMEPATHDDLWKHSKWMNYYGHIKPTNIIDGPQPASTMIWNLYYATIMARIFYFCTPDVIPNAGDIEGIWKLYKQKWNTTLGAATRNEFLANYWAYVKT